MVLYYGHTIGFDMIRDYSPTLGFGKRTGFRYVYTQQQRVVSATASSLFRFFVPLLVATLLQPLKENLSIMEFL